MRGKAEPGLGDQFSERGEILPPRSASIIPKTPTMPSSGNLPFDTEVPPASSPSWNDETTPLNRPKTSTEGPPSSTSVSDYPSEYPSGEPSSVRLPLAGGSRRLTGARIAVVDLDPTRTDALAVALRARGAEVHVASLGGGRAHFRLMRRFAPHALMIDEELMTGDGQVFVGHLRQDPFLSATLLIPVRMDRLFRRRSGTASVESVLQILEPLGRAETDLLARLGPHLEVEFDLDQFPPHRLLRMLARRAEPTTLTCTRDRETFRWTMSRGKMGRAELWRTGAPQPRRLNADDALDWLLGHNNCHVVLSQPADFDEKSGKHVVPLVESQESGLWVMPDTPSASNIRAYYKQQTPSLRPVEVERVDSTPAVADATAEAETTSLQKPSSWKWIAAAGASAAGIGLWIVQTGLLAPTETHTSVALPAPTTAVAPSQTPPSPAEANTEATAKPATRELGAPAPRNAHGNAQEEAPVPSDEPAPTQLSSFFKSPQAPHHSCEQLIGDTPLPTAAQTSLARQHWRIAQKQLVQGKNQEAHISLCQSALLDASGPGSAQLAGFALAKGDVQQAKRWASAVREAKPEDPNVGELYGDVLHQEGNREGALEVWLKALGLDAKDQTRRSTVARVWLKHAETALRASDHPRAERALRRAFEFDPHSPQIRGALGRVFRKQSTERAERWTALSTAEATPNQ